MAAGAGLTEDGKLVGLGREALDAIHRAGLFDIILVEADGSRGKPLKAPAPHEPVLPSKAACVVAVVGAKPLDSPSRSSTYTGGAWLRRWQGRMPAR